MYQQTSRRTFVKQLSLSIVPLILSQMKLFGNVRPLPSVDEFSKGLWPVMITPYNGEGGVDYDTLKQLIQWYEQAGASGLFVNCLSSEMYELSCDERLALSSFVAANSKVPVVSTGTFAHSIEENVRFINELHETGVQGIVLIPGILVDSDENEQVLFERIDEILSQIPTILFGLYECPQPYKRLVSPELLAKLSKHSDRIVYLKETSCDESIFRQKVSATNNTNLQIFNAHTPHAFETARLGAGGLSPIGANFYPELYAFLWKYANDAAYSDTVKSVIDFLIKNEPLISKKYPLSSKFFLRQRGLPILITTRREVLDLTSEETSRLEALLKEYMHFAALHGISLATF